MDMLNVAGWKVDNPFRFLAVRLELPGGDWCWSSGGEQRFAPDPGGPVMAFTDHHPDYGHITAIGLIKDGQVRSALAPDLEVAPATRTGLVALQDEAHLARWTLWQGLVNPDTGAVLGAPMLWEQARLNVPTLLRSADKMSLRFTSMTQDQLLLLPKDHIRQTDAFHKSVWPGELGFSEVVNVNRQVYVRAEAPVSGGVGGGASGGGANNTGSGVNRV